MAKFMIKVQYSREGLQGTVKEGFANREAYIRDLMSNIGLTMEGMYWALGDDDMFAILDGDGPSVVGGALMAALGGIGRVSTVRLLTATEMDAAVSKMPSYRAPGE